MTHMIWILNILLLAPALGGVLSGVFGKQLGKRTSQWITTLLVGLSFVLAVYLFTQMMFFKTIVPFDLSMYHWAVIDHINFNVGYKIDQLTVFMMVVVTFVSLMVHIYSVGYMEGDPSNQRFFSYISGFTFSMLSLVMADNFLVLFFGWEAVGLFSYLLIGFWFNKEKANVAAFRAFIANRVGDLGFILGVAAVLFYFGTLNYSSVFAAVPAFAAKGITLDLLGWHVHGMSLICLLLFAGAAGKSAQIPLHIWLEGSMEGPTPISALIHAATMVTAGVFMIARLSPMFDFSAAALSTVLILGAATALFMGILGIVQTDIKRVIAYSTLSQLGYMMSAQGIAAYPLGMYHLMTHAAFKALLFLSAGSVIVAMHHEQDMRKMGGLGKYMPITYICMLIGACALSAIPPFSGFYSKDLIIEAVHQSTLPGHTIAYWFIALGALVTSLYTFRMFFMVFHGKERLSKEHKAHVKESPLTIVIPLILLAIPALLAGWFFFEPMLHGWFGNSITMMKGHNVLPALAAKYPTPWAFTMHAFTSMTFYLAIGGVFITWLFYVIMPSIPAKIQSNFNWIYTWLVRKYCIDEFYDWFFGKGGMALGRLCANVGDKLIIDKICVNGSGFVVRTASGFIRLIQTGYLYHYAFVMVVGLLVILGCYFLGI